MANCPNCNGMGSIEIDSGAFVDRVTCPTCGGAGDVPLHMTSPSWGRCPERKGTGLHPMSLAINPIRCHSCNGRGWGTRSALR